MCSLESYLVRDFSHFRALSQQSIVLYHPFVPVLCNNTTKIRDNSISSIKQSSIYRMFVARCALVSLPLFLKTKFAGKLKIRNIFQQPEP